MIAHAKIKKIPARLPCSSIEVLCTDEELDVLIGKLLNFKEKVKECNKLAINEDYVHIHYQDDNNLWTSNDCDLVFYINLAPQNDKWQSEDDFKQSRDGSLMQSGDG